MGSTGHPAMASRFFSRTGSSRFGQRQSLAFRSHNFDRFAGRGDRFADRRDQFRDSHGLPDRFADRRDRAFDRADRFRDNRFNRDGRFDRDHRFDRDDRFGRRGEEFREHEFFARRNFFVGFDFAAFGWWPWWYPYYGYGYDGGYYPYYNDSYNGDPQNYDSQYGAEYWNNLAMSVQTELANQGYYHGQVDGVIGSGSIEAIRQFQGDHGLPVTGKIDPKLLRALGINYKAPPSTSSR